MLNGFNQAYFIVELATCLITALILLLRQCRGVRSDNNPCSANIVDELCRVLKWLQRSKVPLCIPPSRSVHSQAKAPVLEAEGQIRESCWVVVMLAQLPLQKVEAVYPCVFELCPEEDFWEGSPELDIDSSGKSMILPCTSTSNT